MAKAFITYLGTDDYLPGVLVLNESLLSFNEFAKFLVLVSNHVSQEIRSYLKKRKIDLIIVEPIINPNPEHSTRSNFQFTYTKLRFFELLEYDKLIYLDADMLVCGNIEDLFERPHFSAVNAGSLLPVNQGWKELNSGLLVIEPTESLCKQVFEKIPSLTSEDHGDQGFLQAFFPDWPNHKTLHLPHQYNVPVSYLDVYCLEHQFSFSYKRRSLKTNIAVLHFWGVLKPWEIDTRFFNRSTDDKLEQALILWSDIYKTALKDTRQQKVNTKYFAA
jgi:glycogenin glucosyltransferase